MGLDTSDDVACRAQNLLIYSHPLNSDIINIGEEDISATKHVPIPAGLAFPMNADDSDSDEDIVYVDLREIFCYSVSSGQLLIVMRLDQVSSTY